MTATETEQRPAVYDPDLVREWDACHLHARDTVVTELERLGAEPATLEHASHLRLYYRVAFLLACWARDAETRRHLTADLGMHVVAMKLLDDLVDEDSGLDRFDLGGGSLRLLLLSLHRLAAHGTGPEMLDWQEKAFDEICRGQLLCKRQPATDFDAWLRYAEDYGERFLGIYGRFGGLAAGLGDEARVPEAFACSFGMIITIADDLTDFHRHDERVGNLGALLRGGAATRGQVEETLDRHRRLALEATASLEMAHDLAPVVENYCADVLGRILPKILEPSRS